MRIYGIETDRCLEDLKRKKPPESEVGCISGKDRIGAGWLASIPSRLCITTVLFARRYQLHASANDLRDDDPCVPALFIIWRSWELFIWFRRHWDIDRALREGRRRSGVCLAVLLEIWGF